MDKNITLHDLQHYFREVDQLEKSIKMNDRCHLGPSRFTLDNLIRYSTALNVMKTSSAGIIYQLAN